MLTTNSQFIYDISLPATDQNTGQGEELKNWTTVLEPKFLTEILGYEMYKDFNTHINDGSGQWFDFIEGKEFVDKLGRQNTWDGFKTVGANPIAYFIYYEWVRNNHTTLTSLGTVMGAMENSTLVGPNDKLVNAWNRMVELLWVMDDYLRQNSTLFPNYLGLNNQPFIESVDYRSNVSNNKYFQPINTMSI